MRKSPTLPLLFGLSVLASLACIGGPSPLGEPGQTNNDPPAAYGLSMYAPDFVSVGETFDVIVTAKKDPVLGASNPPVKILTNVPFSVTPSTYDVTYSGASNQDVRTLRVSVAPDSDGARKTIVAVRENPIGADPTAEASIEVLPYRAAFVPLEPVHIAPGESRTFGVEFTTTAFVPRTVNLVCEPGEGYTYSFSRSEFLIPVGTQTHTAQMTVTAGQGAGSISRNVMLDTGMGSSWGTRFARTPLVLRVPAEGDLSLQVSPTTLTLYPGQNAETTLTAIARGGLAGIVNVQVDAPYYLGRQPATNPIGFNLQPNGRGSETFRWNWSGMTGTPESTDITYRAVVDGKTYTATQRLNFRWEGLRKK